MPINQVYTANALAKEYIKRNLKDKKKAYVIGRQCLVDEIKESGIEVFWAKNHDEKYGNFKFESQDAMNFREFDVVVIGYDDMINLYKFAFASYAIQCGV